MGQVTEAIERPDRRRRLFWGQSHNVSRRVVAVAVALFLVVAVIRYLNMAVSEDLVYLDLARGSLEFVPWQLFLLVVDHPVVIVGLAAISAYLNEGYLPTVLLAVAPSVGVNIWIFSGPFPGPYVLTLKPFVGHWEWVWSVTRSALPWATVGFLVGFVVRWLRTEVVGLSEP